MKIKALTWLEIQEKMCKPVWDKKKKIWRVIDGYREDTVDKRITTTDTNAYYTFEEDRFYSEEVDENE